MEVSSPSQLCLLLISSAFQRCRVSDNLCRLSVLLKPSPPPDPLPILRVSVSDTGIGSCLDEFHDLKFSSEGLGRDKWDGLLYVKTTGIGDDEVYSYQLNLREGGSSRRLTRLPSLPKNGAKFSGTEVCVYFSESVEVVVAEIKCFLRKMLILKIPNVAIEMLIERGSQNENAFLANGSGLTLSFSNAERLKSGLEDYVLKHGNLLSRYCDSCFGSRDDLKFGSGTTHSKGRDGSSGLIVDVAFIVTELEPTCSSSRGCDSRTEVLYFNDFKPCSIPQQSLTELTGIDWKSYGLSLENVVDEGGYVLEWENLPPHTQIAMVLHCYQNKVALPIEKQKTHAGRHLIKRAVKLALDDLKERHAGILLSARALKTLSYAPDLARSIAGLILTSDDPDFQRECFSLLGVHSGEIAGQYVEDCIKEQITSVIQMYDRKSMRSKEMATSLFDDDCSQDSKLLDFEYEQSEDEGLDSFI